MEHRPRRLRGLGRTRRTQWLALALYALGLLAAGLHSSLFRHELCEHGELVHVATAQRDACAHTGAGEHAHDGAQAAETLHAHCPLPLAVAATEPGLPVARESLPESAVALAPSPVDQPRAASIEPLRFAPHHSPPV